MAGKVLREPRKKSFELDYSVAESVSKYLDDKQLAQWFRAVVNYELYGEKPTGIKDKMVLMQVEQTMGILDGKLEKYIARCNRNKDNRNKGLTKEQKEKLQYLKDIGLEDD